MSARKSSPPALGLWLLRHTCRREHREALAGDLVERFQEGQTRSWFWRQVLFAGSISVAGAIQRRWPWFCYAIGGTIAMGFLPYVQPLRQVPATLHWSDLPWPWSQVVFELSATAIVALSSLSILVIGLGIAGSLRWAYLFRTGTINLILITIVHLLPDAFPWLLRPVPGHPYYKTFMIPMYVQIFSVYLIAAWLGCRMTEHGNESEERKAQTPGFR